MLLACLADAVTRFTLARFELDQRRMPLDRGGDDDSKGFARRLVPPEGEYRIASGVYLEWSG